MALSTTLEVIVALGERVDKLNSVIREKLSPGKTLQYLKPIWGVGPILAMTSALETGPGGRFVSPGDFVSGVN